MFNSKKTASTIILMLFLSFSVPSFLVFPANATEDSWTTLEPIPTARRELGVAVVDGKIYAIGGYNGSYLSNNEMYDPDTDTWTTKAPLPTPRRKFGIAVYQNKIYVIGGNPANGSFTGINQVYDPLTDTWENRTPMPTPRHGLCANVVNDKIYLIGGVAALGYADYGVSFKNEVYDRQTDTWTTKAQIPTQVVNYASAVVNNKIYIMGGGYDLFGRGEGRINEIYDPAKDTWTEGEPIPIGFRSASAGATTGAFAPKRIYVFGGFVDPANNACNLTQVYDPETNVWNRGTPMPTPRSEFAVAVVNDVF
jgi:N-acetylneuraminic acid mutarotase